MNGKTIIVALSVALAAPAGALVRLGAGVDLGFALPAAQFDNEAKSAPAASVRLYGNLFHWLTAEAGADVDLTHGAESKTGFGETRLSAYKAGLVYKIDMGVFKPFLAGGWASFQEKIKYEEGWRRVTGQGFYLGPGLEYYISERLAALGMMGYNRAFDAARQGGRDTQLVRLDFGLDYYFW